MTHVLADLGAEVIEIEKHTGDDLRDWTTSGVPVWWQVYARNKKSICVPKQAARCCCGWSRAHRC